jgi:hypothetical protein
MRLQEIDELLILNEAKHLVELSNSDRACLGFSRGLIKIPKISSRIASGDLPQVAEFNTPRSMDAAGECLAYDGFKACKIV